MGMVNLKFKFLVIFYGGRGNVTNIHGDTSSACYGLFLILGNGHLSIYYLSSISFSMLEIFHIKH